jgi:hypothetical protein
MNMKITNHLVIPAIIIGIASIISAVFLAQALSNRGINNTISSTGSAKVRVESDSAKLSGDITRRIDTNQIKAGYSAMESDKLAVVKFLESKGLSAEEYVIGPLLSNDVWNNGSIDYSKQELRQSITIDSSDVQKVRGIAEDATSLVQQGIKFQTYDVQYYYSKLAEERVALLGAAIKDAQLRAGEIAKSAGNSIGSLRSASSGVVQVLAPNSVSVEDYGSYDTSTMEKDIMVTVRAVFEVR